MAAEKRCRTGDEREGRGSSGTLKQWLKRVCMCRLWRAAAGRRRRRQARDRRRYSGRRRRAAPAAASAPRPPLMSGLSPMHTDLPVRLVWAASRTLGAARLAPSRRSAACARTARRRPPRLAAPPGSVLGLATPHSALASVPTSGDFSFDTYYTCVTQFDYTDEIKYVIKNNIELIRDI